MDPRRDPPPRGSEDGDPRLRQAGGASEARASDAGELPLDALEEVIGGLERAWITPGGQPGPSQSDL